MQKALMVKSSKIITPFFSRIQKYHMSWAQEASECVGPIVTFCSRAGT